MQVVRGGARLDTKEVDARGYVSLTARHMVVHITRFIAVTAGAMGGFAVSRLIDWTDTIGYPEYFVIFIFIILGSAIGYLFGGVLGREVARLLCLAEERLSMLAPIDFVLGAIGIVSGGLLGFLSLIHI